MLVTQITKLATTHPYPLIRSTGLYVYHFLSEAYCLASRPYRQTLRAYEDGDYSLNPYPPLFADQKYSYPLPKPIHQLTAADQLPILSPLVDPCKFPIRTADSYCCWQIRRLKGEWPRLPHLYHKIDWPHRLHLLNYQPVPFPTPGSHYLGLAKTPTSLPSPVWFERLVSDSPSEHPTASCSTVSTYHHQHRYLDVVPNCHYIWYQIK